MRKSICQLGGRVFKTSISSRKGCAPCRPPLQTQCVHGSKRHLLCGNVIFCGKKNGTRRTRSLQKCTSTCSAALAAVKVLPAAEHCRCRPGLSPRLAVTGVSPHSRAWWVVALGSSQWGDVLVSCSVTGCAGPHEWVSELLLRVSFSHVLYRFGEILVALKNMHSVTLLSPWTEGYLFSRITEPRSAFIIS